MRVSLPQARSISAYPRVYAPRRTGDLPDIQHPLFAQVSQLQPAVPRPTRRTGWLLCSLAYSLERRARSYLTGGCHQARIAKHGVCYGEILVAKHTLIAVGYGSDFPPTTCDNLANSPA